MNVWVRRSVFGMLVCFAAVRWVSLPSAVTIRDVRSGELVRSMRFDPNAYVGVTAGVDGLPGIAHVDDGANGIVDDRIELGATGSDDRLVVLTERQYLADPVSLPLVLQRGGWIETADLGYAAVRTFYSARNDRGVWEWMAE